MVTSRFVGLKVRNVVGRRTFGFCAYVCVTTSSPSKFYVDRDFSIGYKMEA